MSINVLIINKYEIFREGLKSIFEKDNEFKIAYEASELKKAIEILNNNKINLIIIEYVQAEDLTLIKKIKEFSNVPILVLSTLKTEFEVLSAMKCGINAYCMKDISQEKLKAVAKTVAENAIWIDSRISTQILKIFANTPYKGIEKIKTDYNLTIRECQVLKLITDGKNNNEIAQELVISLYTTKAHVARILQKLEVNDRLQAAVKAIKYNLI